MNENYVLQMTTQIQERRLEEEIASLKCQLRVESIQKKNLKAVFDSKMTGMRGTGTSGDEAMKLEMEQLKAANEQLVKELEKLRTEARKEPEPHPIEQWKEDLQQYYSEKYEKLKDILYSKDDRIQDLIGEVNQQNIDIRNYKRTMRAQESLICRLKEEIHELKNETSGDEIEMEQDEVQEVEWNEKKAD